MNVGEAIVGFLSTEFVTQGMLFLAAFAVTLQFLLYLKRQKGVGSARALWERMKQSQNSDSPFASPNQNLGTFVSTMVSDLKSLTPPEVAGVIPSDIVNQSLQSNRKFTKIFGLVSVSSCLAVIAVVPGALVSLGILGTFSKLLSAMAQIQLTVSQAPTGIDMDSVSAFIGTIPLALSYTVIGIFLSVIVSFLVSMFSTNGLYAQTKGLFVQSFTAHLNKLSSANHLSDFNQADEPDESETVDAQVVDEDTEDAVNEKSDQPAEDYQGHQTSGEDSGSDIEEGTVENQYETSAPDKPQELPKVPSVDKEDQTNAEQPEELPVEVQVSSRPSLYDKYGGYATYRTLFSTFFEQMANESDLQQFFKDADHENLVAHFTDFVCQSIGGDESYSGKSLKEVHKNLHIDDDAFDHFVGVLVEVLEKAGVEPHDIDVATQLIEQTRADIVSEETRRKVS